jgi:hypothetical protein
MTWKHLLLPLLLLDTTTGTITSTIMRIITVISLTTTTLTCTTMVATLTQSLWLTITAIQTSLSRQIRYGIVQGQEVCRKRTGQIPSPILADDKYSCSCTTMQGERWRAAVCASSAATASFHVLRPQVVPSSKVYSSILSIPCSCSDRWQLSVLLLKQNCHCSSQPPHSTTLSTSSLLLLSS